MEKSSEKHSGQGDLFDEAELCSEETRKFIEAHQPEEIKPFPKKSCGRKGLSKSLLRIQQFHYLSDEENQVA